MTTDATDLRRLKDAEWWRIGEALRSIERGREWKASYRTIRDWLGSASAQLGKSPNQLRRYATSLSFLEQLVSEGRLRSLSLGTQIPEVTVDALSRLNRVAPGAVDYLLRNAPESPPSYRRVLGELAEQSIVNASKLGPRARARRIPLMFEQRCLAELQNDPFLLSADHAGLVKPSRLPHGISVDVLLPANSWEWCDACEFSSPAHPSQTIRLLREVAWNARFFRFVWLWIGVEDLAMDRVLDLCDAGQLANVGVVAIGTSTSIEREPQIDPAFHALRDALLLSIRPDSTTAST